MILIKFIMNVGRYSSGKAMSRRCGFRFRSFSQSGVKLVSNKSHSTKSSTDFYKKYNRQIIAGASLLALSGGYLYYGRSSRKPSEGDKKVEEVEEEEDYSKLLLGQDLDESLSLLEEFGPIPYLLVGAGTASIAAFRAIRAKDPTAKVVIIGEEYFYPYMRPPLSKEMWYEDNPDMVKKLSFKQWNGKERSIFFEHEDIYCSVKDLLDKKNGGVSVLRGIKVVKIDPVAQTVYLDNDKTLSYEKCLLAPGGKPKNLRQFEDSDVDVKKNITLFRNVRDFQRLEKVSTKGKSIVIVGGGFLGSELACALGRRGKMSGANIIQVFPESGNMGKVLPEYLSQWTTDRVRSEGVNVITGATIKHVGKNGDKIELLLSNEEILTADHVVIAVGLDPNVDIAVDSGLEVDKVHGGYLVNAELEARKNLWIAGDASCFFDVKLGRRRVEHHDHAVVSGRLAGENMTGSAKPYWHQSMFWSDLGPEIGYEAIGIVDSSLPTVGIFSKATENDTPRSVVQATGESVRSETEEIAEVELPDVELHDARPPEPGDNFGKGVIFYLRDNIVVGLVLWNVFGKMPIARKIISESKAYDDLNEVAKLFSLHSVE